MPGFPSTVGQGECSRPPQSHFLRGVALDRHGCGAGVAFWPAAQRERSLFPSWNDGWRWGLTAQPLLRRKWRSMPGTCLSLRLSEAWWLGLRVTARPVVHFFSSGLIPNFGSPMSKKRGLQMVPPNSSTRSALLDWRNRTNCGRPSSGSGPRCHHFLRTMPPSRSQSMRWAMWAC